MRCRTDGRNPDVVDSPGWVDCSAIAETIDSPDPSQKPGRIGNSPQTLGEEAATRLPDRYYILSPVPSEPQTKTGRMEALHGR
jgi:hypothetical protein